MDKSLQVAGAPAETPKPVYLVRYTSIEGWRVASEEAYWTFSECNRRILYEAAHPAPIAGDVEKDARDAARWRYVRDSETLETAVWEALEGTDCAPGGVFDRSAYAAGMDRAVDAAIAAMLANSSSGEAV